MFVIYEKEKGKYIAIPVYFQSEADWPDDEFDQAMRGEFHGRIDTQNYMDEDDKKILDELCFQEDEEGKWKYGYGPLKWEPDWIIPPSAVIKGIWQDNFEHMLGFELDDCDKEITEEMAEKIATALGLATPPSFFVRLFQNWKNRLKKWHKKNWVRELDDNGEENNSSTLSDGDESDKESD